MTIDITAEMSMERPPAEVAAYAMDPANDPAWIGGIREARLLTPAPIGKGSRVARVAYFLRKRIEYVNEVDVFEPGHLLDMHSVKSPFPMRVTYTFEGDTTTLARIRVAGDPSGIFALAAPLMSRKVKKNVTNDLADQVFDALQWLLRGFESASERDGRALIDDATAMRLDPYTPRMLQLGVKGIIGKGGRGPAATNGTAAPASPGS